MCRNNNGNKNAGVKISNYHSVNSYTIFEGVNYASDVGAKQRGAGLERTPSQEPDVSVTDKV